jgi:transposase InsO family protein
MDLADKGRRLRLLVRDRDSKFTSSFNAVLEAEGAEIVLTPCRTPSANAVCERWIGSARPECLNRMIMLSRRHLERAMRVYVDHHNHHRPHRSLGMRPPAPRRVPQAPGGSASTVRRRERLGGVINEYYTAAA